MQFNSLLFAFFLLIVLASYYYLGKTAKKQNALLLLASYIFYGSWDWRFLSLILLSSFIDYFCGNYIIGSSHEAKRKLALTLSLASNLGLLFVFKYFNFFIESFVQLSHLVGLQPHIHTLKIILPVGISFYTFQTMSFTLDAYKGKITEKASWLNFFTFVAYFPQLVAGPIERASFLLPQFKNRRFFDEEKAVMGLRRILYGLFLKVVIADVIAAHVNYLYSQTNEVSLIRLLPAGILFGIQIYCDFAGYSNIAIGVSRLFNIQLNENFATPYFSHSFSNFWRNWHISLSQWFRDYVYIPLGGNKKGSTKMDINIMITFLLSGLWHGANLNFLIWGFFHGSFLAAEKHLRSFRKLPKAMGIFIVFLSVSVLWVFFRAPSANFALSLFSLPSSFVGAQNELHSLLHQLTHYKLSLFFTFFIFLFFEIVIYRNVSFENFLSQKSISFRYSTYVFMIFAVLLLSFGSEQPQFIYFQF